MAAKEIKGLIAGQRGEGGSGLGAREPVGETLTEIVSVKRVTDIIAEDRGGGAGADAGDRPGVNVAVARMDQVTRKANAAQTEELVLDGAGAGGSRRRAAGPGGELR